MIFTGSGVAVGLGDGVLIAGDTTSNVGVFVWLGGSDCRAVGEEVPVGGNSRVKVADNGGIFVDVEVIAGIAEVDD